VEASSDTSRPGTAYRAARSLTLAALIAALFTLQAPENL